MAVFGISKESDVTQELQKTFKTLVRSKNETAAAVLVAALRGNVASIRSGAVRSLLERRVDSAARELLKAWPTVDDDMKIVAREKASRLTKAIRDALFGRDDSLRKLSCQAAVDVREYDSIGALASAASDHHNPSAALCAASLRNLAELLSDELEAPRDYKRRDPALVRGHAVGSLESIINRTHDRTRPEIIEAFLLLAKRENTTLLRILQDADDPMHPLVSKVLETSRRPGVIRLLVDLLENRQTPRTALNIIRHRTDRRFLQQLFTRFADKVSDRAAANLGRLESLDWTKSKLAQVTSFDDACQDGAVTVAVRSGIDRQIALRVLGRLARDGSEVGRTAALAATAHFEGPDVNRLVLVGLNDAMPAVQAEAARQLSQRDIPGSTKLLMDLLESPHEEVAAAARQSFTDFTIERYLEKFDSLSTTARSETGDLVRRVDVNAAQVLRDELMHEIEGRRLRAIEVAAATRMADSLDAEVAQRLQDDSHLVRAQAARVLATVDSETARQALRGALVDASPIVRQVAEEGLLENLSSTTGSAPPSFAEAAP
jgi:HEAT repeat protein